MSIEVQIPLNERPKFGLHNLSLIEIFGHTRSTVAIEFGVPLDIINSQIRIASGILVHINQESGLCDQFASSDIIYSLVAL